MYFQPGDRGWVDSSQASAVLFRAFTQGTTQYRNSRFKLIPNIVGGNFILRKALPPRPVIIGSKGLKNAYLPGNNFFEVDVDVDSDPTARNVVCACTLSLSL